MGESRRLASSSVGNTICLVETGFIVAGFHTTFIFFGNTKGATGMVRTLPGLVEQHGPLERV